MNILLLFGVAFAPTSWPTLALDLTSVEPWLLIGTALAAGWVWGRYCHQQKWERQPRAATGARVR